MNNGQLIKNAISLGIAGVVALAAIYVLWNINSNDIEHLQGAVEKQTEIYAATTKDTNEVLRNMTGAIEVQTEVMRSIIR